VAVHLGEADLEDGGVVLCGDLVDLGLRSVADQLHVILIFYINVEAVMSSHFYSKMEGWCCG
jgi:hypothetical protein